MGFAELLLAGLLLLPIFSEERYQAFLRAEGQWAAQERSCADLREAVARNGAASQALLDRGDRKGARELLQRTHELAEALTRCNRKGRELLRRVEAERRALAVELTRDIDDLLAGDRRRPERLAVIVRRLEQLEHVRPAGSCVVTRFEEVLFSPEEDPASLQDKRTLIQDLLANIQRQRSEHEEHLARLEGELAMRGALNGFLREIEVLGGGNLTDVCGLTRRDTRTLAALETERGDCRRALGVLETMDDEWRKKLAALEGLLRP